MYYYVRYSFTVLDGGLKAPLLPRPEFTIAEGPGDDRGADLVCCPAAQTDPALVLMSGFQSV